MSNIKRYNGTSWEKIPIMADKATADVYGNNISTTYAKKADIYTKTETDSKLSAKQDKLVSGTNIKTINGSNILGSGNVTISASVPTASSTTLGGIKIGFNNPSNLSAYPVQLDASNKAYVNIPIYYYEGATYGECYEIDAPTYEYSMAIGTSGFTVDSGVPGGNTRSSNILQVDSDKFQYRQSDVMTGATKYLQSAYFKHWHGMFVCPSNTYYYRLIAKATNSGSSTGLYQTITIRGTVGGWGSSEQCEFMYVVALRNDNFSTANNIRKTIFRGSTYTTESTIASNSGIDIVTHRDSSSGALYVYLRAYGTQKYSQYNIIVTANGQEGVVTLPTDENFYTSSSGTLVSGSQLLSSTQNQCIEITNQNLKTINGNSLVGSGNISVTASISKATTSTIGGIKAANVRSSAVTTTQGSTDHLYGVEVDSNGKAFVNVPWTDTTYPNALNVVSTSSQHFYGYRYNDPGWGIEICSGSVGDFPSIGSGGYSQKYVSVDFTHSSGESNYFFVARGSKHLTVQLVGKSNTGFTFRLYNAELSPTTANTIYVDWIGVKTW